MFGVPLTSNQKFCLLCKAGIVVIVIGFTISAFLK